MATVIIDPRTQIMCAYFTDHQSPFQNQYWVCLRRGNKNQSEIRRIGAGQCDITGQEYELHFGFQEERPFIEAAKAYYEDLTATSEEFAATKECAISIAEKMLRHVMMQAGVIDDTPIDHKKPKKIVPKTIQHAQCSISKGVLIAYVTNPEFNNCCWFAAWNNNGETYRNVGWTADIDAYPWEHDVIVDGTAAQAFRDAIRTYELQGAESRETAIKLGDDLFRTVMWQAGIKPEDTPAASAHRVTLEEAGGVLSGLSGLFPDVD